MDCPVRLLFLIQPVVLYRPKDRFLSYATLGEYLPLMSDVLAGRVAWDLRPCALTGSRHLHVFVFLYACLLQTAAFPMRFLPALLPFPPLVLFDRVWYNGVA